MYVIGTAGHVDHGKSTLVKALTGIDPDRLKEEKEREMTIDLGFAWLNPGDDRDEIGIVDVPGHRDFIENMLAGVGGIDLVLLVVAADEGVMPQTREHLAILDLLGIPAGVVALTKTDLVKEPDWLELVTLDLSETLSGTVLEEAPIINVSAHTGEGIVELKDTLLAELSRREPQADHGRPRLPVDRVFSLSGFGTIVTGTLSGGRLSVGDSVEVQPQGLSARIRGLQTHKTKLEVARPGSRVAVNLSGVNQDALARGDVVAAPGVVAGTVLCDVSYRHLPESKMALKHNREVKLFVGAKEVMARTRVLGQRQVEPGEEGWLQLELAEPVVMSPEDRFILRLPSPPSTIGGGKILDPFPGRRHRRFKPDTLDRLETLAEGTPAEILLQSVKRYEPVGREEAIARSTLPKTTAESAWQILQESGQLLRFQQLYLSRDRFERDVATLVSILADFHGAYPLRDGMPREELRSRLGMPAALFNRFLLHGEVAEQVSAAGATVRLVSHTVRFSAEQEAEIDRLMKEMAEAAVNSPNASEVKARLGDELYSALIQQNRLVQISDDVVYRRDTLDALIGRITDHLRLKGRLSAAEVRDLLGTSRKYAIGLLEYLDEQRITRRLGDERELATQGGQERE